IKYGFSLYFYPRLWISVVVNRYWYSLVSFHYLYIGKQQQQQQFIYNNPSKIGSPCIIYSYL
ncbi:MAG: hypothetical protein ACI8RD_011053, partial [Bacillariaceae sp.]